MPSLSFRAKLILAMMLLVTGVITIILVISHQRLEEAYTENAQQQFDSNSRELAARVEARLAALKENSRVFARSVRFISFLNEWATSPDPETAEFFYDTVEDEFSKPGSPSAGGNRISFFRIYDGKGELMPVPNPGATTEQINQQLVRFHEMIQSLKEQEVGYFNIQTGQTDPDLCVILLTPFVDAVEEQTVGTLLLAIPLRSLEAPIETTGGRNMIWIDGQVHFGELPKDVTGAIAQELASAPGTSGLLRLKIGEIPHLVCYRRLSSASGFPPAYHLYVRSLEGLLSRQKEFRWQVLQLGAFAMGSALLLSMFLARGLSGPINRLVEATQEVERGNYGLEVPIRAKDEIGRLTHSFNEMSAGLLLKEKYRSVLDMVADKQIAEDLINGKIELGGEERVVSVLFCDIRGFTALTERMQPHQVIEMLNDHFTPLTRLVYQHHGAVDKFVGDLIMAIFGAPKSFGNDARNAAECALAMIAQRERLNGSSARTIRMGIGVATGRVVAGRMGSQDRLNYTVLGPKVNLASRLCSQAGPMEVVIDDETWEAIRHQAQATPTPELRLKGFAATIQAYKLHSINPIQPNFEHEPLPVS